MLKASVLVFCFGEFLLRSTAAYDYCDSPDRCLLAGNCPAAMSHLRRGVQHGLKRCDWIGMNELVCCPPPSHEATQKPTNNTETKASESGTRKRENAVRKSVQACNELSNEIPVQITRHISNGEETYVGEFPHMAALGYDSDDKDGIEWVGCGGSLISNRYVLTAAHCVVRQDKKTPLRVRLGKIDVNGNSDGVKAHDYEVENFTFHPGYEPGKYNDIALLRLKREVVTNNNVQPACLYDKDDDPLDLIISGWGITGRLGPPSDLLLKAEVKPVDVQTCNRTYSSAPLPRFVQGTQICAISRDEVVRDTCTGDSGGPLQFRNLRESTVYSIVGVTSYGDTCGGTRKIPSVYTRVYSYLDWIESIVWP